MRTKIGVTLQNRPVLSKLEQIAACFRETT